ncbi:MAG: hypothetical protein GY821_01620 [Gammaproteobacteria bacterium]|nr:hypothetical protein [Gammaproteobacteria bacterium]
MSFLYEFERRNGRRSRILLREIDRYIVKLANCHNSIQFLKNCYIHGLIPRFLQLQRRFSFSAADKILKNCEIRLLKGVIRSEFERLHGLQNSFNRLWLEFECLVSVEDINRLTVGRDRLYSMQWQRVRTRTNKKFENLFLKTSHYYNNSSGSHYASHSSQVPLSATPSVVNLSTRPLTPDESSVLKLGLNFVRAPSKPPVLDIIASAELISQQLCPSIATRFRSSVASCLKKAKSPSPNLSFAQIKALKSLKMDSSIIIAKADKGNATVVMNSADYREKITNLLGDSSTYEEISLRANSTPQTRVNSLGEELNKTLRDLLRINRVSEEEKTLMMFHSGVPSRFYGLPKIHKPGVPLRPIVSAVNNFCDRMALHLKRILGPLIGKSNSFIKDSSDFVQKLKKVKNGSGHIMVSFDVVSLFTKVPINESCKIIESNLASDPRLTQRTAMSPSSQHHSLSPKIRPSIVLFPGKFEMVSPN